VSELIDIKCLLEKVDEYIHLERVLLAFRDGNGPRLIFRFPG